MYITLEADYAIRIVNCLAQAQGVRLEAQKISESTCVSLRFALKILRKLVASGLVASFKGAKGGYVLAKAPNEISLRDVIEVVEGPYHFSRCLQEDYPCSHTGTDYCAFHRVFDDISRDVRAKLDRVTFASGSSSGQP